MADSVTVTFMTDERLLERAARSMTHRKRETRVTYLFFGGLFLCGLAHLAAASTGALRPVHPVMYAAILGGTGAGFITTWLSPRLAIRRLIAGNANARGPHTVRLSAAGYHAQSPFGAVDLQWAAIREVWEDVLFLYFYVSESHAQIVPKDQFAPSDLEVVRRSMDAWLAPDAAAKNHMLRYPEGAA
jgi:hypothetical protein